MSSPPYFTPHSTQRWAEQVMPNKYFHRIGGVYGETSSGLQARWGSDLDSQIQRPKLPNTALPDDIRKKLGFNLRRESADRQRQLLPEENEKSKTPETLKKQPFLKKGGSLSSRDQAGLNCSEEIKAKKGRKIGILTTSIAKQSITFDKKTPIN